MGCHRGGFLDADQTVVPRHGLAVFVRANSEWVRRAAARRGGPEISRRNVVLLAVAAPMLACCSSDPDSDSASLARLVGRSLNPFSGGSSVTLDEVASVPFASLGVRIGSGPQTLLVLAAQTEKSTLWTSSARIALEIQSGRVTRTAGLAHNLSGTVVSGADPLESGLHNLRDSVAVQRTLDFADRNAFGTPVDSTVSPAGSAAIDVLGTPIRVVHAIEHCTCATLAWTFTNEYWADQENGLVWRSKQFIHPDLDVLEVELFRPPRDRS